MHASRFAVVADQFFDGERLQRAPHTVRVEDGRVAGIDWGDFAEILMVEGWAVERGAFLMPGLVDAHVHLFLDGAATDFPHRVEHLKAPVDQLAEAARSHARETLAWGVTLVRDAGDRHAINHRIRAEAACAGSGLPKVRSAGYGIKRPRRYGAFMGHDAGDACSVEAMVEELAHASDEIKLILTGVIDLDSGAEADAPQFTQEEATLVVAVAHRRGRKVMAHCSGPHGLAIAVAAGVDSIEHGFFMDRDTLARMRDGDQAWTPTIGPVHFQWAHPEVARWPAATVGAMRRLLDEHAEHLRIAHAMGVRLLVGSDAGSMGVHHGRGLYEEMRHLHDAGLPLEAVLHAATGGPRRHFGERHPVLAAGVPFEAVLLPTEPLSQRRALQQPRRVWAAAA